MGSELSTVEWLVIGAAGIFVLSVVFGFVVNFNDAFNTQVQEMDIDQGVKDDYARESSKIPARLDQMFLAAFVIMSFACILVARTQGIATIWWGFLFMVILLISAAGGWMSNSYAELAVGLDVSLEALMPFTHHILSNFLVYILVVGFASLILSGGGRAEL